MKLTKTKLLPFFFLFLLSILLSSFHSSAQNSNVEEEEDVKRSQFPDGFLFGTSTSSYQVEGATLEGGKGLNNWDVFTHLPGTIKNGDNGDIADDHYHRYLGDIEIMQSLGVNAYRLSISWARILPRGRFGDVNPIGISFYNKIIDDLLLRGIEPFVTITHHDIPHELEERYGTWLSPQIQEDFVHFTEICFKSFGDRIKYWATINEPNLFIEMAYIRGTYPPAHCSEPFGNCSVGNSDVEPLIAMHNMILSHAKAAKLYRDKYQPKQGGLIGIVVSAFMYEPLRDEVVDRQAVSRGLAFYAGWVLDPLVFGDYPCEMRHYHGKELPRFTPEEMKYIAGSIDFIGINHYSSFYAKDCLYSSCPITADRPIRGFVYTTGERDGVPIGEPTGMSNVFVVPRGMEEIIDYVKEKYNNKPIFVTENGYAQQANESEEMGELLQDVKRVQFHKAYLAALARSIKKGADVRGYFIWTVMDNFEWVEGYSIRFGLYYVDRHSLNRFPKLSATWFTNFLANTSHNYYIEKIDIDSFHSKDVVIN